MGAIGTDRPALGGLLVGGGMVQRRTISQCHIAVTMEWRDVGIHSKVWLICIFFRFILLAAVILWKDPNVFSSQVSTATPNSSLIPYLNLCYLPIFTKQPKLSAKQPQPWNHNKHPSAQLGSRTLLRGPIFYSYYEKLLLLQPFCVEKTFQSPCYYYLLLLFMKFLAHSSHKHLFWHYTILLVTTVTHSSTKVAKPMIQKSHIFTQRHSCFPVHKPIHTGVLRWVRSAFSTLHFATPLLKRGLIDMWPTDGIVSTAFWKRLNFTFSSFISIY